MTPREQRQVVGWVQAGDPDPFAPRHECPDCGFDSVVDVPLYMLTRTGVGRLPRTARICGRCADPNGGTPA